MTHQINPRRTSPPAGGVARPARPAPTPIDLGEPGLFYVLHVLTLSWSIAGLVSLLAVVVKACLGGE